MFECSTEVGENDAWKSEPNLSGAAGEGEKEIGGADREVALQMD